MQITGIILAFTRLETTWIKAKYVSSTEDPFRISPRSAMPCNQLPGNNLYNAFYPQTLRAISNTGIDKLFNNIIKRNQSFPAFNSGKSKQLKGSSKN